MVPLDVDSTILALWEILLLCQSGIRELCVGVLRSIEISIRNFWMSWFDIDVPCGMGHECWALCFLLRYICD